MTCWNIDGKWIALYHTSGNAAVKSRAVIDGDDGDGNDDGDADKEANHDWAGRKPRIWRQAALSRLRPSQYAYAYSGETKASN